MVTAWVPSLRRSVRTGRRSSRRSRSRTWLSTVSVESTETATHAVEAAEYLVPHWVRVRREDFGILFYDARSARLTFVASGDSLEPPPFTGTRRALRVATLDGSRQAAVARLLQDLVRRGLIIAVEPD